MFKRKKKQNLAVKALNFFWPPLGWKRLSRYILIRLSRLPGTARSIACGFACGAAISFTPFVGLHFLLGGVWAWLMRGNVIAALFGTAVGNPWTFPFIWIWIYKVGQILSFSDANEDPQNIRFAEIFKQIVDSILHAGFSQFIELSTPIFWPMLLGSLPTMLLVWIIFYLLLNKMIKNLGKLD